jgi:predicted transcriptional regulator
MLLDFGRKIVKKKRDKMKETYDTHKEVLDNYENIYPMLSIIYKSKTRYIQQNMSIPLHASQIELLKTAKKHSRPSHKSARIKKYKNMTDSEKTDKIFQYHLKSYLEKYQKLASKGVVTIDEETDELPFDVILTQEGEDLINEIKELEEKWEDIALEGIEDKDKLLEQFKSITYNIIPITYNKNTEKFTFN